MYRIKRFSQDKERESKVKISKQLDRSLRGHGRSILVGNLGGEVGLIGAQYGADKDYQDGLESHEIVERAGKRGAAYGAAAGGLLGLRFGKFGAAANAGLGAVGGYLGARRNTQGRINNTNSRLHKEEKKLNK